MGPVFKRLTANYPPILLHPVNSITAYKGQIIYDTPETEAKAQTPVSYLQWLPAPGVTPPVVHHDGNSVHLDPASRRSQSRDRRPRSHPGKRRSVPAPAPWAAQPTDPGVDRAATPGAAGVALAVTQSLARPRPCCRRVLVQRRELAGHARHRRTRPRPDRHHRGTTRRGESAAELAGQGRRRHGRQRVGHRRHAAFPTARSSRRSSCPWTPTSIFRRTQPRRVAQTSLLALNTLHSAPPDTVPGAAGQVDQRLDGPIGPGGPATPTTEEALSSLGMVVSKGNLGAMQDITDEVYAAVAGRAGQFDDLVPRLAELTTSLDRQTTDIIAAAEGLNRFAGILARRQRQHSRRALDSLPGALQASTTTPTSWSTRSPPSDAFSEVAVAGAVGRPSPTSPPTSRTPTRWSRHSPTMPTTGRLAASRCRRPSRSRYKYLRQAVRGDVINAFVTFDLTLRRTRRDGVHDLARAATRT